ncbi:minor tail protein [Microbacterium phage RobinRose]|nr:minor tail protein [Microbacterium phage RobinRose]
MIPRHCTVHHAVIYDRGGSRRLGEIKRISEIEWTRDRDGVSEAAITIQSKGDCDSQRSFIRKIAEKRHELVIFRGDQRVWEGPIWRISDLGGVIQIFARDVCAYLFGTMLSKDWDNRKNVVPMTTRLGGIIAYELATTRTGRKMGGGTATLTAWESLDPPINVLPHLQVHHFPNEAETAAYTRAFSTTVGAHMASAARQSGVDFTAVGRSIHLWDTSRWIGQIRTLTEADFFGNIIVTGYGADHTQAAYSTGQEGAYGEAINTENLEFYGPWSTSYTPYNEEGSEAPTIGALNSQAARNASGRSPVPVEVRVPDNSSIRLGDSLSINDLVPGVRVPLLATLNARAQNQMQKLDHLVVTETSEREDVKITLSPSNRSDSDVEE